MKVHWLEQTKQDLPEENDWLSAGEISFLSRLRFAKRSADWRLGRWTAKHAVAAYLNLPRSPQALSRLEIRPARSGAPEAFCENKSAAVSISVSHSENRALCVVAPPAIDLGCDLELIEPRSDAFLSDYFTAQEQALVMREPVPNRPLLLTLFWSAKESALKALCEGLRLDTRSVIVAPVDLPSGLHDWSPLEVRCDAGKIFRGWWQNGNQMVRTVVAAPPPEPPVRLEVPAHPRERIFESLPGDKPTEGRVSTTEPQ